MDPSLPDQPAKNILEHVQEASGQKRPLLSRVKSLLSRLKLPRFKLFKPKSNLPSPTSSKSKLAKRAAFIVSCFLFIVLLLALITAYPLLQIKASAQKAQTSGRELYDALKDQDLILAKQKLADTKLHLDSIRKNYALLIFYKASPLYWHYTDGQHGLKAASAALDAAEIGINALQPYADVLGFAGQGSFEGGSAQERIVRIIETLGQVTPAIDEIALKLDSIDAEISQINPARYPFYFRGQPVSDLILKAQESIAQADSQVRDIKPVLEVLPSIAGLEEDKKYLVIFQNDAEIRPTGGFMTAYGIIRVEKGTVHQEKSDDIYELDNKFNSRLKPPEPIQKYLPLVYYWYLRDMNLSPDFKASMDTFLEHYRTIKSEPGDEIDGVIAVDTQLLSSLIQVLGPIDVPGFGTYSAETDERCDCPQVIYALEDISTRPAAYVRDDRKAFLVPMMQTLIQKSYSSPNAVWPRLFKTVYANIQQKHVLFYFFDETAQTAAEGIGFAGRIQDYDGDYLHITDTNFGGAKSDLFINLEVEDNITTGQGGTRHELSITYKNPAPASNCDLEAGKLCLNGTYRDYFRLFLPPGSQLDEALGFEEGTTATGEDLGKTYVEGFFTFQPESQAKLKITYTTPYQPSDQYNILIQKQPGRKVPKYTLILNGVDKQEFDLAGDKEITFELE